MTIRLTALASLLLALALAPPASAAGPGGVTTGFESKVVSETQTATAVVAQPDGSIVAAGASGAHSLVTVVRYTPLGAPDSTFGTHGIVTLPGLGARNAVGAVLRQADGKLVVVTYSVNGSLRVARLLADGALDPGYGSAGIATPSVSPGPPILPARIAALTPSGRLLVALKGRVVALAPSGALDPGFGAGGVATLAGSLFPTGLALASSGDVLVTGQQGTHLALVRLTPAGLPRPGVAGSQVIPAPAGAPFAEVLGDPSDAALVAVPYSSGELRNVQLQRYRPDGTLDPAYGTAGTAVILVDPFPGRGYPQLLSAPGGGARLVAGAGNKEISADGRLVEPSGRTVALPFGGGQFAGRAVAPVTVSFRLPPPSRQGFVLNAAAPRPDGGVAIVGGVAIDVDDGGAGVESSSEWALLTLRADLSLDRAFGLARAVRARVRVRHADPRAVARRASGGVPLLVSMARRGTMKVTILAGRDVVIAHRYVLFLGAATRHVRIPLNHAGLHLLRHRRAVRIRTRVTAEDLAGNTVRLPSRAITLRR